MGLVSRHSSRASLAIMRSSASSSAIRIEIELGCTLIGGILLGLPHRQGDGECRTPPRCTSRGDGPAVSLGDLAADRQADPRPLVFGTPVEALENGEDLFGVDLLEPDPV